MLISKEAFQQLIGENHFYVAFFKKNGELRHLYGQLGTHTELKGTNRRQYSGNEYILAYDHVNRGYRNINLKKTYKIQTGACILVDSEMEKIFEQDRAYSGADSNRTWNWNDYVERSVFNNIVKKKNERLHNNNR